MKIVIFSQFNVKDVQSQLSLESGIWSRRSASKEQDAGYHRFHVNPSQGTLGELRPKNPAVSIGRRPLS